MKPLWILVLAISVPGCFVSLPFTTKEEEKPTATVQRQPVMPEQVKENNAHKMAESLDEEVTVDETTPVQKPEEKKPAKK